MEVVKKDGTKVPFNPVKIFDAVKKSANRCNQHLSELDLVRLEYLVLNNIEDVVEVKELHKTVETCLSMINPEVSKSYKEYRNYKTDFVEMWDNIYNKTKEALYVGDKENSNFESTLVSTKGSLVKGYLAKELYTKFNLNPEERKATEDGFIYQHDQRDLIFNGINCIDQDGWVTIKYSGEIKTIQLKDLIVMFNLGLGVTKLSNGLQIMSRSGWSTVEGVSVRKTRVNEPLYNIETSHGITLKATGEHRIPVNNGEYEVLKYVKDLTTGDNIIHSQGIVETNTYDVLDLINFMSDGNVNIVDTQSLKDFVKYKYGTSLRYIINEKLGFKIERNVRAIPLHLFKKIREYINIPYDVYNTLGLCRKGSSVKIPLLLNVSRELARMMGYVFAGGHVSSSTTSGSYQVCFSNTNKNLLDDYIMCVKTAFPDVNISTHEPTDKSTTPCTNVVISNAVIWEIFSNFKRNSGDIRIPDFICNGSDSLKYSFIAAAIDCDGSIGTQIKYTTVCKVYAEQFHGILKSLRYHPTLTTVATKGSIYKNGEVCGFRNYDTNHIKISSYGEIKQLCTNMDSYKSKYFNLDEKKGAVRSSSRIRGIHTTVEDRLVFDLETSDSWFIVNDVVVHNCCLFDMANVLSGGFEMSNLKYKEPSSVLSALQVIGDVILATSSQGFGGFTVPEIDTISIKYMKKSIDKLRIEAKEFMVKDEEKYILTKLQQEVSQGIQSLEMKLNSIPSSRGDFAFTTLSFGALSEDPYDRKLQKMFCETLLHTRMMGNGKGEPVVFPKLVFLFLKAQYDKYQDYKDLFSLAIKCSSKALYPDYLAVDTQGQVAEYYKSSGKIVSPMGCRAYLSDFKEEDGESVFTSRANIGAVSLNLPMIWKESDGGRFYEDLDYYLEMIRDLHKKRYDTLAKSKCSSNPMAFCQGGLYKGNKNPNDNIGYDIVKSFTASFGVTALNELNVLKEGKPLHLSDKKFVNQVMDYINHKVEQFKLQDGYLYAVYYTPAESLSGTQLQQFRKRFGVIEGVSDKEYFSNGFHLHVSADITPFEKQNMEYELFHKGNGGHIQYCRYNNPDNLKAIESTVLRAMDMGFYEGVNFELVVCENCGFRPKTEVEYCPECSSNKILSLSRACGYISYKKIHGDTRFNKAKLAEIKDRVSM